MPTSYEPLPQSVFVAGATGYLGRHICAEYQRRGWHVTALVRDAGRAGDLDADILVEAEATRPETLTGVMDGASVVVSSLGITRQTDGLDYADVDYRANMNLLTEAQKSSVTRFGYVHVLNADGMPNVPLVVAKSAFVRRLEASTIPSTVISPSGYFSDMGDFLKMAQSGRVWLFGDGSHLINPIHGSDLARAVADAVTEGRDRLDIGGPETYSHAELAEMAFAALDQPARITRLPDRIRRILLAGAPHFTPRRIHGPATFFLTAMGLDMVGQPHGTRRLADHFGEQAKSGDVSTKAESKLT